MNYDGDPLPAEQGTLVAQDVVRGVERATAKLRLFELALVSLTCIAAIIALAFAASSSARSREVARIIAACTTPGGDCYETNRQAGLEFRQAVLSRLDAVRDKILDATNCITEQLAEHRQANETAHELEAHQHGYLYSPPAGTIPPPVPEQLRAACRPFIPPEQGGTK